MTNLTPNGIPRAVIDADLAIDNARSYDLRRAEQMLKNAQLTDADKVSIELKLALWDKKADLLQNAFMTRKPKLRLTPPIDPELWDVQSLNEQGIDAEKTRWR